MHICHVEKERQLHAAANPVCIPTALYTTLPELETNSESSGALLEMKPGPFKVNPQHSGRRLEENSEGISNIICILQIRSASRD